VRYVVYGAGAIGGGIGGCLALAGADVVLVARGAHLEAMVAKGLQLHQPDDSVAVNVPAVGHISEAGLRPGDVVILAVKSQHTAEVIDQLVGVGEPDLSVVCAQNGVDNERQALRYFARVYGTCVMMPATYIDPGEVEVQDGPVRGVLDLGRYPTGADETAETIAAALRPAGFAAEVHPAIMTRKYRKLLANLGNALDAAAGRDGRHSFLAEAARREAWTCFDAAGIEVGSEEEDEERRSLLKTRPSRNGRESGSSSWQSLARGSASIEAGYLNGEIVLLGRLHGIATPVNELLAGLAADLVRRHAAPASMSVAELHGAAAQRGILPPLRAGSVRVVGPNMPLTHPGRTCAG
jgi:2-dehydropantoate 2-reductase